MLFYLASGAIGSSRLNFANRLPLFSLVERKGLLTRWIFYSYLFDVDFANILPFAHGFKRMELFCYCDDLFRVCNIGRNNDKMCKYVSQSSKSEVNR